jgi:hypothetical protein
MDFRQQVAWWLCADRVRVRVWAKFRGSNPAFVGLVGGKGGVGGRRRREEEAYHNEAYCNEAYHLKGRHAILVLCLLGKRDKRVKGMKEKCGRARALARSAVGGRRSEGEDLGLGFESPLRRLGGGGGRRTDGRGRRTEDG